MITDVEQRAVDGQFGQVYVEGVWQNDIRDFQGTISIEQRPIRVAGTQRTIFRRGPVARNGSFTLLKVDSRFEKFIINYTNLSPDERRKLRGEGVDPMPDATIVVKLDDPDSWGCEEIQLQGCKFWALPIGFNMNAVTERNITVTWDSNVLLKGIPRPDSLSSESGFNPPTGQTTWPAAGNTPTI